VVGTRLTKPLLANSESSLGLGAFNASVSLSSATPGYNFVWGMHPTMSPVFSKLVLYKYGAIIPHPTISSKYISLFGSAVMNL